jgi:hypothetical protein
MNLSEIRAEQKKVEELPMGPERWQKELDIQTEISKTQEYDDYKKEVVKEGVERWGEETRAMWEGFSYEREFFNELTPEENIDAQIESME